MADLTNQQLLDAIAQMFVDTNERIGNLEGRFDAMHRDFEKHRREYAQHRREFERHCREFEKLHQEEHATERKVETLRSGIAEAAHAAQ